MFSSLNNLEDISLDPGFATICGYRGEDLEHVFGPELADFGRDEIRRWYSGYHWRRGTLVYNPYDVLLPLRSHEFRTYWFETGSLNFLFRMLMERAVSPTEMEGRMADMSLVSHFDVGATEIEALHFQTGYLTIVDERREGYRTLY